MIISQISYLDCLAFLLLLVPQLFIQVGILGTIKCVVQVLPFFVFRLPILLLTEDYLTPPSRRAAFHAKAPLFPTIVIRCVRYAFANLPAQIGAVFFSKPVALPFARWRMLRNGYWPSSPSDPSNPSPYATALGFKHPDVYFTERRVDGHSLKGLWAIADPRRSPDIIVYYLHGGGFAMGSPWFYLEFLFAWLELLRTPNDSSKKAWRNPAVFAPDYTLVPAATYPTQVKQVLQGWGLVCNIAQAAEKHGDSVKVELAGDSAGGTLCLSLLLLLARRHRQGGQFDDMVNSMALRMPDHATLISAWCRLVSEENKDTRSDYLNADSLHLYARQYLGKERHTEDDRFHTTIASPAKCQDLNEWQVAMPRGGIHFIYGAEEVLAGENKNLIQRLKRFQNVQVTEEEAGIHAWPVVDLFLGGPDSRRLKGLRKIVEQSKRRLTEEK